MNRKELEAKAEEWLAIKEAEGLRPDTLRSYRDHIFTFIKGLRSDLTPFTFAAFFRDYSKDHSPVSARQIFGMARMFLRGVEREDLIPKMKKPRGEASPKKVYSEGQLRALFQVLRNDRTHTGMRDYAIVCLLRFGGLRVSEVCRLRLDDLTERDTVKIRDGKSRYAVREVPLPAPAPSVVMGYIARGRPKLLKGWSELLFLTYDGRELSRETVRMLLRRTGEEVGFPLSAHRFRHTWVTDHVRARTNPTIIGRMVGWSPKSTYDMLGTYAHPDLTDLRAAQEEAFR